METLGPKNVSRRSFLKVVGVFTITASTAPLFGCVVPENPDTDACLGYIVVDSRKCQGCLTCMISCSLAHEGVVNLSKSRIQVAQSSFRHFPDDTVINQCHQCEDPECVKACAAFWENMGGQPPVLTIDKENGNIRMVDESRCVGCGSCSRACPFTPERPKLWDGKSHKCDLCVNTPYHFNPEVGGGVEGIQTCVAACPLKAIHFVTDLPAADGYDTNLRPEDWGNLGYSMM